MAKKQVIQHHSIVYRDAPVGEWVVPVTKGEHHVITRLQWLKSLSPGARAALLFEIARKPERRLEE